MDILLNLRSRAGKERCNRGIISSTEPHRRLRRFGKSGSVGEWLKRNLRDFSADAIDRMRRMQHMHPRGTFHTVSLSGLLNKYSCVEQRRKRTFNMWFRIARTILPCSQKLLTFHRILLEDIVLELVNPPTLPRAFECATRPSKYK